jgi:hypothetical protein
MNKQITEALNKIAQMSDSGNSETTITRMKEIAVNALKNEQLKTIEPTDKDMRWALLKVKDYGVYLDSLKAIDELTDEQIQSAIEKVLVPEQKQITDEEIETLAEKEYPFDNICSSQIKRAFWKGFKAALNKQ